MSTAYEALDMNEVMMESERVNAEPGVNNNEEYLAKFVRMPEREGFVLMRFLPRKKGTKLFCATRTHTLNNPLTNQKRAYHCPKELFQADRNGKMVSQWKGECIICKYYNDLWSKSQSLSGKEAEALQAKAREIKPVERYYYNVIVRQEKDSKTGEINKNVGPKIYSCGKQVHAKIMRAMVGDKDAGEAPLGDVTHPVTGRDFKVVKKITKSGNNEYPNYDFSKFESETPAGSSEDLNNWLDNIHDLHSLRKLKTEDELKHALRVHLGMVQEGETKQDDDLEEFRNATGFGATPNSAAAVVGDTSVREDLVSQTDNSKSSSSSSSSSEEQELLADDDFMKELDAV
jgi:hypothetical protein